MLKLPLWQRVQLDRQAWLRTESGQFIVKAAYNSLMENDIGAIEDPIISKICKSKLHYRLKMHLWRITLDILPTKEKTEQVCF